jgi:hypothetical protein
MKLGTETGSLVNHLMSQSGAGVPVVGKGATELMWTDRHAYFVNYVSEDLKRCVIERALAIRVDKNGMSEAQSYEFERTGGEIELRFKWGKWRYRGKNEWDKNKWYPMNIQFGGMNEYYDFSF